MRRVVDGGAAPLTPTSTTKWFMSQCRMQGVQLATGPIRTQWRACSFRRRPCAPDRAASRPLATPRSAGAASAGRCPVQWAAATIARWQARPHSAPRSAGITARGGRSPAQAPLAETTKVRSSRGGRRAGPAHSRLRRPSTGANSHSIRRLRSSSTSACACRSTSGCLRRRTPSPGRVHGHRDAGTSVRPRRRSAVGAASVCVASSPAPAGVRDTCSTRPV